MSQRHAGMARVTVLAGHEKILTANFLLACGIILASFSSFYFLLATLPVYVMEVGGTEGQVGLIIGLFAGTALPLRPFVGKAADEHGRRPFILVGTVLFTLCCGLYAFARSVPSLLMLRILQGVGFAAFGTANGALVADIAPRSRRGETMGYYGMSTNLAMAVGPAVGILLLNASSFPVLFAACTAVAALAVPMALALREPERKGRPNPDTAAAGRGLVERSTLFPALILTLVAMTYGSIISFVPLYANQQGIGNPGWFFTAYAITLIAARGFTGQLSDRYGRALVVAPGIALAVVALGLLAVAGSLPLFVASAALYGLAFAAVQPAMMALIVDKAAVDRRGAAMAIFSGSMDLGIGIGAFLGGIVVEAAGFEAMYLASGSVALVALILFLGDALRDNGPGGLL